MLDGAAVLFAWEQLGLAETALTQARDYALQRFALAARSALIRRSSTSWPICVKNTLARSNAYYGVWALSEGTSCRWQPLPRVAAIQASTYAAEENIQTHGGMGFTWNLIATFICAGRSY